MNSSLRVFSLCAAMLAILPASALAHSNPSDNVATPGTVSKFNLPGKTEIPGHTLKPGAYAITVVDHLSDRIVLRVNDSSGKEEAIFLAVPATSNLPSPSQSGPIEMKLGKGSGTALRGFKFDDGTVAEFVYPKAQAVTLAKANSTTIPAVDPASEGRPASADLSSGDRALVTLWMLTPTSVGPGNQPGIQAERYHAAVPANNAVASNAVPAKAAPSAPALEARATAPPKPVRVAHPIAALPHTAGDLPLIMLVGSLSLLAAAFLTLYRTRSQPVR